MIDAIWLLWADQVGEINVGPTITGLIGSMGAAGATLATAYYILAFFKDMSVVIKTQFDALADRQDASQKAFQDQLDRMTARQEQSEQALRELTRELIAAIESVQRRPARARPDPGGP